MGISAALSRSRHSAAPFFRLGRCPHLGEWPVDPVRDVGQRGLLSGREATRSTVFGYGESTDEATDPSSAWAAYSFITRSSARWSVSLVVDFARPTASANSVSEQVRGVS